MEFLPHIITANSIIVVVGGNSVTVNRDTTLYPQVFEAIRKQDWKLVAALSDRVNAVKNLSKGRFDVIHGIVHIDGEALPDAISRRVLQFQEEGLPFQVLLDFWANLKNNPSQRARRALFTFLEHAGHPLTEDGCFLAYKRIRADWRDCHTGTILNRIGDIVEMDRDDVDDDPARTCSSGLHVASRNYAVNFYSDNGRLVYVKVNPADVVAIPVDYNNEKMRVCRYEVMREDAGKIEGALVTTSGEVFETALKIPTEEDFDNFYNDDDDEFLIGFAEAFHAPEPKVDWPAMSMCQEKAEAIRGYANEHPNKKHKKIAKRFGVGRSCVSHVLRGSTWS